ncbi:MAG: polyprenyl synthetase family protein [Planctomycetes bacterium]|nr:polyprenyl synthetase family protein [Planctomycetota bacterium]MBL7043610.1 polyprenyl synthetase family protein [Pirellulaceae bacterium]
MNTLSDNLRYKLTGRNVAPLIKLLDVYDDEKDIAKCYSSFAFLSCAGSGGSQILAETMARVIEGFYMATSVHDDVLDAHDEHVRQHRTLMSPNTYMILGDCFFVEIAVALARATPLIPISNRDVTIERFEQYMYDTAESQIADEHSHGTIPTPDDAIAQMKLRGGTWGRLSMEVPALAGGLSESEAVELGDAGENLFMGLTVRDDLRDLRDDIRNSVLTLAPALFLEGYDGEATEFHQVDDSSQIEALVDLISSDGAIERSLACGRDYTTRAIAQLRSFLQGRDEMNWFLLQMIFRLTNKRIQEFTPDHVLTGELGIGFSALNEVLDAVDG